MADIDSLPGDVYASLQRIGLIKPEEKVEAQRLTGGVSSEIWKVSAGRRIFCVKRALPKLQVEDDWEVPVERNVYERRWYELVGAKVPGAAPTVLAHDDRAMLFAMSYLDPAERPLWKHQLAAGVVDLGLATAVGTRLAAIHSATAGDPMVATAFETGPLFEALRLEPYLRQAGRRNPEQAARLGALAERTASTHRALVHGDVSPKNILNDNGLPIFLDAECAWYGDPAFDLAFCLNHLLLKNFLVPAAGERLFDAFNALANAYLHGVDWEPPSELEDRAASLLPALLLARVDGKSPVEYLTADEERRRVRSVACTLLSHPPRTLSEVTAAWRKEFNQE